MNDNDRTAPLFAELAQQIERTERLERRVSMLAWAGGLGLTVGEFILNSPFSGIAAGCCLLLGVLAGRLQR